MNTIKVFDLSGKKVLEANQNTFDISSLETGAYFVSVEDKKGRTDTIKLIKK